MSSSGFLHATRVAGVDVMDFKNCLLIGGSLFCRRAVSILGMVLAVLAIVGVCAQAQDAVGIGPTTLGSASGAVSVPFTFSAAGTLGSVDVLTEGAAGAEFSDAGTGTCNTTTSFVANSTCNVNVTFAPAYAGLRKGAVVLKDLTGTPGATVFLYGMGVGPQVAFSPAVESVIAADLQRPAGIAVDGSGSVYIADTNNNRVVKETLSHGIYSQSVFASDLNGPTGLAIDGASNLFIADSGNNRVLRVMASGSISTVASDLSNPTGVAVDASGNVYIADTNNNRVVKETRSSDGFSQTEVATGLNAPSGVAVDAEGNIYIADSGNDRVLKLMPSEGGFAQSVLADVSSGLINPTAVAVSGTGSLYIADAGSNRVLKLTPSGNTYNESVVADSQTKGLLNPAAVATSANGTLYIADRDNSRVLKEDVANASLDFGNVGIDYGGSAATKTLILANIGNAPLNLSVPSAGYNPSISADFVLGGSSTCPQLSGASSPAALEAGSSCDFEISFKPAAEGDVTGSLTITDDALPQVQVVGLSGVGVVIADATITFGNLSQTYTGSPLSPTVTTTPSGLAVAITYNGSSLAPVDAGSYEVIATIDDPSYKGTMTGVLVINKCALWVKTTDVSMKYGSAVPPLTGTVRGAAPGDDVTITYATVASSTSGVSTYTILPELHDPNNRLHNYIVFLTNGVLTIEPAPLFVTAGDVGTTYGSAIPSLTGTLTGIANNDPITATYSTTAVRMSNAGTYPITATVVASPEVLANYAVTNTPGTLTIDKAPGTAVLLSTSGANAHHGETVTFTARVTNGAGVPDGVIAFYDDAALLGTVPLANGAAVYRNTELEIGTHAVKAVYAGSTNFASAESAVVSEVVLTPALSINASAPNSTLGTVTVAQGGSGSTTFHVGSLGTVSSTVSVSCSGLPAGIPCQVSPSTINGGALPATVTVTIRTENKIAADNLRHRRLTDFGWTLAVLLPGMVVISRKRRARFALVAAIALAMILGLSACGGGVSSSNASTVVPRGAATYTATITATSSGATPVTSTLTVVVPQS